MSAPGVLVIGGGVLGLGAAWRLAQAGASVTVLEQGPRFCGEASLAAAGMIGAQSEALEDDAYFAATLDSRDRWPALAAELQQASGLGLGYHPDGCIHLAFGASYERRLDSKYLWQKRRAGTVTRFDGEAMRSRWPMLSSRVSSVFFADGDQWVDNERLGPALVEACRRAGVTLCADEGVVGIERAAGGWALKSSRGRALAAEQVVVANGAWAKALLEPLLPGLEAVKAFPVKGQMLELRVPPHLMPDVPVHAENVYLVPRDGDRLIVGATVETVGFDKRITAEGLEYLLFNAFETIPDLRGCEVLRSWAGLRPGSPDGWPVLGPGPEAGLHFALGAFRRGILLLPLVAESVAASVLGRPLPPAAAAFHYARRRELVGIAAAKF
jgi:glycine oxidase